MVDDISIKCMVQEIVDKIYVKELDEDYIGYNNQTRKIILTHLKNNWCIIIPLEKKKAAENFRIQCDGTPHITKYVREIDKQQRLCRDIGVPAHDLNKIQYHVENIYVSKIFDENKMTVWGTKQHPVKHGLRVNPSLNICTAASTNTWRSVRPGPADLKALTASPTVQSQPCNPITVHQHSLV